MAISAPHATRGAGSGPAAGDGTPRRAGHVVSRDVMVVALLTAVGAALRLAAADQSLFGDELSTYFIVSTHGLRGTIATVRDKFEITPPLYFILAWLSTRAGLSTELLRAPSVLAGTAAIPLVYAIGVRTVGRAAGRAAAALTALAPFMIYYSSEARGYELMTVFVLLSTLALLAAVRDRRARWWVAYGACTCAAAYTHYTSVFALGPQLLWVLWAHPAARRMAILANVAAVVAFLPWLGGLSNDLASPDNRIMSLLTPFTPQAVRIAIEHWTVGYPYAFPATELRDLPGVVGLSLQALGLALGLAGLAVVLARSRPRVGRGVTLVVAMALSAPVAQAAVSAAGPNMLTARNLAVGWPWFGLTLAAVLVAGRPRLARPAVALVLAGFALGAVKMVTGQDFRRPDFKGAARFIDRRAAPRDYVIDGAVVFMTPGPVTGLDAALERRHPILRAGVSQQRERNFRFEDPVLTDGEVLRKADAGTGRRILVLTTEQEGTTSAPVWDKLMGALPTRYRRVETRAFPAAVRLVVHVYEKR